MLHLGQTLEGKNVHVSEGHTLKHMDGDVYVLCDVDGYRVGEVWYTHLHGRRVVNALSHIVKFKLTSNDTDRVSVCYKKII